LERRGVHLDAKVPLFMNSEGNRLTSEW
jgi:hypothetical protein